MSTDVTRQYENKVFPQGLFKRFALGLARLLNVLPTDVYILLQRTEEGFQTSTELALDELVNIYEIGKTINSLSFHSCSSIIKFKINLYSNSLNIIYVINGDIEKAKKIIFLTENIFELEGLNEQGAGMLTTDNNQSIVVTHMDSNHNNISNSNKNDSLDKAEAMKSFFGSISTDMTLEQIREERLIRKHGTPKEQILFFIEKANNEDLERILAFIKENYY